MKNTIVNFFLILIFVGAPLCQAQNVSYASPADVQARLIKLSEDARDSSRWGNLNQDFQDFFNTYLSWTQGSQVALQQKLDSLQAQIDLNKEASASNAAQIAALQVEIQDLNNKLALAYTFDIAFPCQPLNLAVTTDSLNNRYFSFTTASDQCTGWNNWSNQTNLQVTRTQPSWQGNFSSYSTTRSDHFRFAMPATLAAHGVLQAVAFDKNGMKYTSQLEY